jgi:hypothetical protein
MTRVAKPQDAAYLNRIIRDLDDDASASLSEGAMREIDRRIRAEGTTFVTDEMVADAWEGQTGQRAHGKDFDRFRAQVFFSVFIDRVDLDESRARGNAATALRQLASTPPRVSTDETFLTRALGAPVDDVDVSIGNRRIYLRAAGSHRGAYMPTEGLAVLYQRNDGWALGLPTTDDAPARELFFSADPTKLNPSVLTPSERAAHEQAAAALCDLLHDYLGLEDVEDPVLRDRVDREDLDPETKAFARAALEAVSTLAAVDARTPASETRRELHADELTPEALELIASFRDGDYVFEGRMETDIPYRTTVHSREEETIDELAKLVGEGAAPPRE